MTDEQWIQFAGRFRFYSLAEFKNKLMGIELTSGQAIKLFNLIKEYYVLDNQLVEFILAKIREN
jgi:hypothetical protein